MHIRILGLLALLCYAGQGADHGEGIPSPRAVAAGPSVKQETPNNDRVLVVLFSGFQSCGDTDFLNGLKEKSLVAIRQAHPKKTVDFVRYCYDSSKGSIRVQLPGATALSKEETSIRESLLHLSQLQQDYEYTVLIGHSWGGWSVLAAVEGMEKPSLVNPNPGKGAEFTGLFSDGIRDGWEEGAKDFRKGNSPKIDPRSSKQKALDEAKDFDDFDGGYWIGYEEGLEAAKTHKETQVVPPLKASLLVTIDPISGKLGVGCNPGTVIRGSPPCKEFPVDIDQQKVANNTGSWLNYYQDQGERVHSGSAQKASNTLASQRLVGTHGSVKNDPQLESQVTEAIVKALGD